MKYKGRCKGIFIIFSISSAPKLKLAHLHFYRTIVFLRPKVDRWLPSNLIQFLNYISKVFYFLMTWGFFNLFLPNTSLKEMTPFQYCNNSWKKSDIFCEAFH